MMIENLEFYFHLAAVIVLTVVICAFALKMFYTKKDKRDVLFDESPPPKRPEVDDLPEVKYPQFLGDVDLFVKIKKKRKAKKAKPPQSVDLPTDL